MPRCYLALFLIVVCAAVPEAQAQTVMYMGYRGTGASTGDGLQGVTAIIDYKPVQVVGTKVLVWCGIDNGGAGAAWTASLQAGWEHSSGATAATYFEFAPQSGDYPNSVRRGNGALVTGRLTYAVYKATDQFGNSVARFVARDASNVTVMFQEYLWDDLSDPRLCCSFFGAEVKDSSTDHFPGSSGDRCCISDVGVLDSNWFAPSTAPRTDSAWGTLVTETNGFCIYDNRNI